VLCVSLRHLSYRLIDERWNSNSTFQFLIAGAPSKERRRLIEDGCVTAGVMLQGISRPEQTALQPLPHHLGTAPAWPSPDDLQHKGELRCSSDMPRVWRPAALNDGEMNFLLGSGNHENVQEKSGRITYLIEEYIHSKSRFDDGGGGR